ncbi:MAG: Gfo/Idh/MocA family oxidoreductase [Candidatus Poribacteria bacterium]|nr:Gfo/Idh/MocA family oxidoreductase [Candidatus Poribacteria bacterium]
MSHPVKVGFIGTGGIANSHLRQLTTMENASITALCDIVEERANAAVEQYGGTAYTDYRKMLDEAELDAVYFCLPPFAHSDAEIIAAERGLHLFVQKPVVLELETGIKIAEAIQKAGVISCVGYQSRYSNVATAARNFLSDKTIGMVACHRWGGIAGGPDHWWRVMEKSGGMLHEQATHQLDMLRYTAGDIVEVYKIDAMKINVNQENHTIPDAEVVTLQFESGAVGYITTSSALIHGGGSSRTDFIIEGHFILQLSRGEVQIIPEGAATIEVPDTPALSIDEAFIQAIQTGNQSIIRSSYSDGLKSAAVTIAANQSSLEHRPIRVPVC